jgi:hypothetical protein
MRRPPLRSAFLLFMFSPSEDASTDGSKGARLPNLDRLIGATELRQLRAALQDLR